MYSEVLWNSKMLNLHIQHVQKHQFSKISAFPFQLALLWLSLARVVQGNQRLYPFCWGCMILSQVWFVCCSHLKQLVFASQINLINSWGSCAWGPCFLLGCMVTLWWCLHSFGFLIHQYSVWFPKGCQSQLFLQTLFSMCQTRLTSLFPNLRYYHRWWLWYPSVKSTVVQDKDWNSKSGKEEKKFKWMK